MHIANTNHLRHYIICRILPEKQTKVVIRCEKDIDVVSSILIKLGIEFKEEDK